MIDDHAPPAVVAHSSLPVGVRLVNVGQLISQLERMTVTELRRKYTEIFGEETRSHHIAWRVQANAEGDLAERARRLRDRALAIADDADLRMRASAPGRREPDATPSTTAVVMKVTGAYWNGYLFFGLRGDSVQSVHSPSGIHGGRGRKVECDIPVHHWSLQHEDDDNGETRHTARDADHVSVHPHERYRPGSCGAI